MDAKWGISTIPRSALVESDPEFLSYPIRAGAEVVGYVVADPGKENASGFGLTILLLLLASAISTIVLLLAQRRVHRGVRSQIAGLTSPIRSRRS